MTDRLPRRDSLPRINISNNSRSHTISSPFHHAPPRASSSSSSPSVSKTVTVPLTRFSPPSPIKTIPYPHTASHRLSSTLRPGRRSSLVQLGRRRIVHLLLALSIPMLALALLHGYAFMPTAERWLHGRSSSQSDSSSIKYLRRALWISWS